MGLTLEQVVPWGRSLAEYRTMFDLTPTNLGCNILDCAAEPASFNAEMTAQGYHVTSCDPIYQFSTEAIAQRIADTYSIILNGVEANLDSYLWQAIESPAQLGEVRLAAMGQFLADFPIGLQTQRYRQDALPHLPFPDQEFDLALCSHFLFTYSDHLGLEFHQAAIAELIRVAKEVRIFPLLKVSGEPSPFLPVIQAELMAQGLNVQIKQVPYEFQKGGNQLLQIRPTQTSEVLTRQQASLNG